MSFTFFTQVEAPLVIDLDDEESNDGCIYMRKKKVTFNEQFCYVDNEKVYYEEVERIVMDEFERTFLRDDNDSDSDSDSDSASDWNGSETTEASSLDTVSDLDPDDTIHIVNPDEEDQLLDEEAEEEAVTVDDVTLMMNETGLEIPDAIDVELYWVFI
ncbi:hypothetical protein CBS101457_002877 [Exobasidium rhododendri]|nr:hypothetical protein CBS101457_002877 [Exobasidium rhododendri]